MLLITAGLLFILSFLHLTESIDIHLHDTYFVFRGSTLYWGISLLFLLFWGIYRLTDKYLLTTYLTWLHVVITITGLVYCFIVFFPSSRVLVVLIAAQLGFVVNVLGGLIKLVVYGKTQE